MLQDTAAAEGLSQHPWAALSTPAYIDDPVSLPPPGEELYQQLNLKLHVAVNSVTHTPTPTHTQLHCGLIPVVN